MYSDIKKRRSFVALLFAAGDSHRSPLIVGVVILSNEKDVAATIIALEHTALDRWGKTPPVI